MKILHFSTDTPETRNDRLKEIRPAVDLLLNRFQKVRMPGEYICIDQSLMKFRGRLFYVQYNPLKTARSGIKI
jgi:hypothetical protein